MLVGPADSTSLPPQSQSGPADCGMGEGGEEGSAPHPDLCDGDFISVVRLGVPVPIAKALNTNNYASSSSWGTRTDCQGFKHK